MDSLGGSYRFWGFVRRIQGKVSLLGVSAKTQSWLPLRLMGIAFGGVLALLGLFVRLLHLTAFLLFVLNSRVLTIAHMYISNQLALVPGLGFAVERWELVLKAAKVCNCHRL